jgi:ABC-2 type transport system permease protein
MAVTTSAGKELQIVGPRRTVRQYLREVRGYRELFVSLVRKELKIRYKQSTIGLVWSMIQPIFLLVIYSVVFSVLGAGFADFGIWILCGLIVWGFVSTSVTATTGSIVSNGQLVGKVRFPRAILPAAAIGSAAVHFILQLATFGVVLLVTRHDVDWAFMWVLPFAIVSLVIFLTALGLLLAAANVYARDTQHLLDFAIQGWFWLTPIVYTYGRIEGWLVPRDLAAWLPLVNPITPVVICFQRALYGTASVDGVPLLPDLGPWWYLRTVLLFGAGSIIALIGAIRVFDRAEADMAEML